MLVNTLGRCKVLFGFIILGEHRQTGVNNIGQGMNVNQQVFGSSYVLEQLNLKEEEE